jgi:hypothetical protein
LQKDDLKNSAISKFIRWICHDKKQLLKFSYNGSNSINCEDGDISIKVDKQKATLLSRDTLSFRGEEKSYPSPIFLASKE